MAIILCVLGDKKNAPHLPPLGESGGRGVRAPSSITTKIPKRCQQSYGVCALCVFSRLFSPHSGLHNGSPALQGRVPAMPEPVGSAIVGDCFGRAAPIYAGCRYSLAMTTGKRVMVHPHPLPLFRVAEGRSCLPAARMPLAATQQLPSSRHQVGAGARG